MKQHELKLNPAAIAVLLAVIGAMSGWIATAHAASATNPANGNTSAKSVHTAQGDKPEATKAVKNARSTRAALRSTRDTMEATRQTQRR